VKLKLHVAVVVCDVFQNLVIRLTDEKDPFFLYTLSLGEDDFQG